MSVVYRQSNARILEHTVRMQSWDRFHLFSGGTHTASDDVYSRPLSKDIDGMGW